ncbi:MAG TPA: helicase-associated domain-containing protein [Nocardioidaceae bacterium]|nr:helicase-associated domain-containing protein [Nocardioidaceae bacterium]
MSETATPRTLADQLRSWGPAELVRLLTRRPDLATPAPQDSAQLASRAGTRASVLRAVDQLDLLELTVLDAAIAVGGTATVEDLHRHVHAAQESVDRAVDTLVAMALLWGPPEQLRTLSVLGDIVGTSVSGLGPSAESLLSSYGPNRVGTLARDLGVAPSGERHHDIARIAAHLAVRENLDELLAEVDPQARKILDHLEQQGTEGTVESTERTVGRRDARSPVDQLLSRGLLIARDRRHVAVPREVTIGLRGGRTTRQPADVEPPLATSSRGQALVDRAAAGAAFELVRHVELLLEHWGNTPPGALRSGGLGVRELKAAAELLHLDEPTTALHIEVALAAGLVAVGATEDLDAAWLPTDGFDIWNAASVAERWARLALAWLDNPRLTGLVGTRDDNRKQLNTLAPDLERGWLPETRRMALEQLAGLEEGTVLAAGTGPASLVERMKWLRPRRPSQRSEAIGWLAQEAAVLGVAGLGGLAAHGRALLSVEDPRHEAPAALEPLLPEPVDHILLQADLTAVAPGPLEQELAHNLATMADIESRGGATVYRFTATSVRRAFDSGWSAGEIHEFVAAASRTPVPQPLVYLVDDVSRRFGTVRVGAAESFLRSDDEAALAELVHDPKAASLRLRRIAPTVVISDVPVDVLLPRLRELGTAPVVEAPDGTVRLARKDAQRARSPRHRPPVAQARAGARISATVNAIRAGDEAAANRPTGAEQAPAGPMSTMAALREAVETGSTVWIGYVDNHGTTVERVVEPVKVEGGWLSAFDRRSDSVRSFAVHRIMGVNVVGRGR